MLLKCKACGAAIDADHIDLARDIATCPYCGAVTRLEEVRRSATEAPPAVRPRVELPPRFTVEDTFGGLTIRRRWFSPAILFLAVFAVGWDSFLVFWYATAFATGAPWIMVVFPVVHLAVGVVLTYSVVACFLNTTTVTAEDGRLTVRHGPLPWPGNTDLETADFDQLYCEEKVHRGKNGESRTYAVSALTRGGTKRKLLDGLTDADQAVFIEQRLEDYLKIKDRPVAGEMSR
jgi:hypothetical protein